MAIFTAMNMVQYAVEGTVLATGGVSRKVVNVFNYETGGGVLYSTLNKVAMATQFNAAIWSNIAPLLHQSYVGSTIRVWLLNIAGDTPSATIAPSNGAKAGNRLPLSVALYSSTLSGVRGRWYNGSKRYGPVAEGDVVGDELTATAQASWQIAAAFAAQSWVFNLAMLFLPHLPVVWSRYLAEAVPPPAGQIVAQLTGTHLNKTLSSWRHRKERTVR